jgi:hypothetical protein
MLLHASLDDVVSDSCGLRSTKSSHANLCGHSQIGLLEHLHRKNFTEEIVRLAPDLQVTFVADRNRKAASG